MSVLHRLIRFRDLAAVITWAVISLIALRIVYDAPAAYEGLLAITATWQVVYLVAMLVATANGNLPGEPLTRWVALAVQLGAAFSLAFTASATIPPDVHPR